MQRRTELDDLGGEAARANYSLPLLANTLAAEPVKPPRNKAWNQLDGTLE